MASLGEPELVNEDVPLRVPLVAVHVLGQEVDLLGVVQVDPRRLQVSSWSISVHSAAAALGLVASSDSALVICAWMDGSQNSAMFGLASLLAWMLPQPSSTFRKSAGAG